MKAGGLVGVFLLLLSACGGSDDGGRPRTTSALCDEMCGWPDSCFVELGVSTPADDCVQSCEAQAEVVGFDCLRAIADTVNCLGTCEVEAITQSQALACQDEAEAIGSACE